MMKKKNLIPEGESCSGENGLCPYWEPVAYDGEDVTRAKCNFLDYEESVDYQCTFLWGMLKNCKIKQKVISRVSS